MYGLSIVANSEHSLWGTVHGPGNGASDRGGAVGAWGLLHWRRRSIMAVR